MHTSLTTPGLKYLPVSFPEFGAFVRHYRRKLGLSRACAAASAGITPGEWHLFEQGWVPDTDDNFMRTLAGTLEIKYEELDYVIAPILSVLSCYED